MHQFLYFICGKCILVCTSLMGNSSCSSPHLWEMYNYFYLIYKKYITVSTSIVGMLHCVQLTCGKSSFFLRRISDIIVTSSTVGNISLSLPNVWEIHYCLYFNWLKCIMVYCSSLWYTAISLPTMRVMKHFLHLTNENSSLSLPLQWEMNHCLYLTHVKCSIVST